MAVGAMSNAASREVSRTVREERDDDPAGAVKPLIIADPEGYESLEGVEGPWPRRRRWWPCCATPCEEKSKIDGQAL